MVAAALGGAALCAGSFARRAGALAFGLLAVLPAWWAETPLVRGVLGLISWLLVMRLVDLVRVRTPFSLARRAWHLLSAVDSRLLEPAPRRVDFRGVAALLAWLALGVGGGALAWVAPRFGGLGVRWLGGALIGYAAVESIWTSVRVAYGALGFGTPTLHRHPIAARTLRELWSERWATPVSHWLNANIFRPVTRLGFPRLGLLAAFAASGVGHAYGVLVALGWPMALAMLGFFVVQGVLMVVERVLGVSARAWVVVAMLASSPLFTEPMLRCLGFEFPLP